MYDDIRDAVEEVLDPDRFLEGAPARFWRAAQRALSSTWAAGTTAAAWRHQDGGVIDVGQHKLRFLETPHVHNWDSMMLFEEKTKSLFPSDLFIQPGDQPPVVTENLGTEMCGFYREMGSSPTRIPSAGWSTASSDWTDWIHGMHGGSLQREAIWYYVRALREEPFAYRGKMLGRELPTETGAAQTANG
jgi:flavorubredoxin